MRWDVILVILSIPIGLILYIVPTLLTGIEYYFIANGFQYSYNSVIMSQTIIITIGIAIFMITFEFVLFIILIFSGNSWKSTILYLYLCPLLLFTINIIPLIYILILPLFSILIIIGIIRLCFKKYKSTYIQI